MYYTGVGRQATKQHEGSNVINLSSFGDPIHSFKHIDKATIHIVATAGKMIPIPVLTVPVIATPLPTDRQRYEVSIRPENRTPDNGEWQIQKSPANRRCFVLADRYGHNGTRRSFHSRHCIFHHGLQPPSEYKCSIRLQLSCVIRNSQFE